MGSRFSGFTEGYLVFSGTVSMLGLSILSWMVARLLSKKEDEDL
jgi:hypothetical protein